MRNMKMQKRDKSCSPDSIHTAPSASRARTLQFAWQCFWKHTCHLSTWQESTRGMNSSPSTQHTHLASPKVIRLLSTSCKVLWTGQSTCISISNTTPSTSSEANHNLLTGPLTQAFLTLCVFSSYTQADYRYTTKNPAPVMLLEWLLSYFGSGKQSLPTWIQGWKSSLF